MNLNQKIFIRLGTYVGVILTLFFIVYQIKYPNIENLYIYLIFLAIGAGLVLALFLEYKEYFSRYDINQKVVDSDFLVKELDRVNQELKDKDNQLLMMSSFAGQGIILINNHKEIMYANELARKRLSLLDTQSKSYINQIRHTKIKDQINRTFMDVVPYKDTHMIQNKNLEIKTIPTEQSKDQFILVIIDDLTEKLQLQTIKKDFFSYAGHELKTPITILRGYAELIHQEIITGKEATEISAKMIDLADYMKGFVDDMLMLSRLETFTDGPLETLKLKDIILNTIEYFNNAIKEKQIKLELDLDDILFEADPMDMQKLFKNMLENAIKYNKENGLINISIKKVLNQIVFTISDTGLGIPFSEQDRIFERFYRVNDKRKTPGTGLGLAIVKHIVNKYHGHISVESVENEYTKFIIVI
ncbi:sensor histidine kinase [Acholeplasma granularum]|uniref:sensor histidine kinase n=1 Tax=Acholeplasma granularum TaxID=264635 RepID=UPI00047010E0|nr:ATP-binding protein [Acholeplasma granularum]